MSEPKEAAVIEEQPELAEIPDHVEREETEIDGLIRKSTEQALSLHRNLTEKDIEDILARRAKLIETMRRIAIRQTQPRHWTLYRARDGNITAVPSSPATLVMRRWAGISIFNHRSMSGEPGKATRTEGVNHKNEPVFTLEMQADARCGREQITVYANVRSDDQFTGRTQRKPEHGGSRPEDLQLSLRTMLDTKAVRVMLAVTKITPEELKAAGIDVERCTKGSGFGSATERQAGAVSEQGVRAAAESLWKEILRRTNGNEVEAKQVLKDITSYPAFTGRDGTKIKAFDGIDSWEKFTTGEKVLKAGEKLKKHEVFGNEPQGE